MVETLTFNDSMTLEDLIWNILEHSQDIHGTILNI